MKSKTLKNEHCPYCKRHCSLDNPNCGKGKAFAQEKLSQILSTESKEEKDDKDSQEVRLNQLFKKISRKYLKHMKKRKKNKHFLLKFESLTQEEKDILESIVSKMLKK